MENTPSTPEDRLKAFTENGELKATLQRTLRQLEKAKASKQELVEAVYASARDAISALHIDPVPAPVLDDSPRAPETAIAVLSDWQLAKTTPTYNSDICAQRIIEYADKVEHITKIQRSYHPVNRLRVYLVGDLVEGELIFGGQPHRIDASLFRQVLVDGPNILGGFLRRMLTLFPEVHVVGCIGNHGSLGGKARADYHPESNADSMLYETTRQILQGEERLTWAPTWTPNERHWYAIDKVSDKHSFLLFHGDQVKGGFAGFPWYGFSKKIMGWRMGGIPEPFNYAVSGHFHTPVRMLIGNVRLWGNGSTESSNTYAAEMLAAQGTPSQWLLFCHPEQGVSAEYEIHLT